MARDATAYDGNLNTTAKLYNFIFAEVYYCAINFKLTSLIEKPDKLYDIGVI